MSTEHLDTGSLKLVIEFLEVISSTFDTNTLLSKTTEYIVSKFMCGNATVYLNGNTHRFYENERTTKTYAAVEGAVMKHLQDSRVIVSISNLRQDNATAAIEGIERIAPRMLAIPLLEGKDFLGAVILYAEQDLYRQAPLLEVLGQKFSRHALAVRNYQQLHHSAITDPLTGLYNRTYFTEALKRELSRCAIDKKPTSLLIFDIDNFKQFNDSRGHLEGDRILVQMAEAVRQHIRPTDLCCRYGGEEFVIMLPEAEGSIALRRAEELRQLVERECELTVSIGLVTCLNSSASYREMLAHADKAMYKAKALGKNRVVSLVMLDKSLGVIDVNEANSLGKV